jgi:hypothetical protein
MTDATPRPVLPGEILITSVQMKKVWHSTKTLGWTSAQLHQLVDELTGKTSLRTLSREEAARLIDRLVACGAEKTTTPRPTPARAVPLGENVVEVMTPAQVGMIHRLCWHLGWKPEDPAFRAWLQEHTGSEIIRTKPEASRVINLLRGKMKGAGLEDQVARSHQKHGGQIAF